MINVPKTSYLKTPGRLHLINTDSIAFFPRQKTRLINLLIVLTFTLTGCGGGGASPETSGTNNSTEVPTQLASANPFAVIEGNSAVPIGDIESVSDLIDRDPRLTGLKWILDESEEAQGLRRSGTQYTLIAPSNKAFSPYSARQLERMKNQEHSLTSFLDYHFLDNLFFTGSEDGEQGPNVQGSILTSSTSDGVLHLHHKGNVYPVSDTYVFDDAVVYIIDDLFGTYGLFDPDPGSIADSLTQQFGGNVFSNALSVTKWHGLLGNSESSWTVFLPDYSAAYAVYNFASARHEYGQAVLGDDTPRAIHFKNFIEDHLVAHTRHEDTLLDPGTLTTVSGVPIDIAFNSTHLTANNHDILDTSPIEFTNGSVYKVRTPLISKQNSAEPELTKTLYQTLANLAARTNDDQDFNLTAAHLFQKIIESTGQIDRYDDPSERLTLFLPKPKVVPFTDNVIRLYAATGEWGNCHYPSALASFVVQSENPDFELIPDVFPNELSALDYLHAHTLAGADEVFFGSSIFDEPKLTLAGETLDSTSILSVYEHNSSWSLTEKALRSSLFEHIASPSNGTIYTINSEIKTSQLTAADDVCSESGFNLRESTAAKITRAGHTDFMMALVRANEGDSLDSGAAFVTFIPTNDALSARAVDTFTYQEAKDFVESHTTTNTTLWPGTIRSRNHSEYSVTMDSAGNASVNGIPATPLDASMPNLYILNSALD